MRKDSLQGTTGQRVIIFPALTSRVSDRRVYFLFSVLQVKDIIRTASVHPVPFSPSFLEGIASWREFVVPVISLEACLGMENTGTRHPRRFMVVRTAGKEPDHGEGLLCMLNVDPAIRMASLPIKCTPVKNGGIPKRDLVRGLYEWEEGLLVVVHMENIVGGEIEIDLQKGPNI